MSCERSPLRHQRSRSQVGRELGLSGRPRIMQCKLLLSMSAASGMGRSRTYVRARCWPTDPLTGPCRMEEPEEDGVQTSQARRDGDIRAVSWGRGGHYQIPGTAPVSRPRHPVYARTSDTGLGHGARCASVSMQASARLHTGIPLPSRQPSPIGRGLRLPRVVADESPHRDLLFVTWLVEHKSQ